MCSCHWRWLPCPSACGGRSIVHAVVLGWESSLQYLPHWPPSCWFTTESFSESHTHSVISLHHVVTNNRSSVLKPVHTKSSNYKIYCLHLHHYKLVLFVTSLSVCECVQIYLPWLPVHSVLAAMYLLRRGDNCGEYWTTVSSGKLLHTFSHIITLKLCSQP